MHAVELLDMVHKCAGECTQSWQHELSNVKYTNKYNIYNWSILYIRICMKTLGLAPNVGLKLRALLESRTQQRNQMDNCVLELVEVRNYRNLLWHIADILSVYIRYCHVIAFSECEVVIFTWTRDDSLMNWPALSYWHGWMSMKQEETQYWRSCQRIANYCEECVAR